MKKYRTVLHINKGEYTVDKRSVNIPVGSIVLSWPLFDEEPPQGSLKLTLEYENPDANP